MWGKGRRASAVVAKIPTHPTLATYVGARRHTPAEVLAFLIGIVVILHLFLPHIGKRLPRWSRQRNIRIPEDRLRTIRIPRDVVGSGIVVEAVIWVRMLICTWIKRSVQPAVVVLCVELDEVTSVKGAISFSFYVDVLFFSAGEELEWNGGQRRSGRCQCRRGLC